VTLSARRRLTSLSATYSPVTYKSVAHPTAHRQWHLIAIEDRPKPGKAAPYCHWQRPRPVFHDHVRKASYARAFLS
jgi:hypothetical protein